MVRLPCCKRVKPENAARKFKHPAPVLSNRAVTCLINRSRNILEVGAGCLRNAFGVERAKNRTKSRVRSRVEHVFGIMKLKFGFVKVRYPRIEEERQSPVCHLRPGEPVRIRYAIENYLESTGSREEPQISKSARVRLVVKTGVYPTSLASACQCRGCGTHLPAWIAKEYGSLTPRRCTDSGLCNVSKRGLHSVYVCITCQPSRKFPFSKIRLFSSSVIAVRSAF
jgi:hypothetical protein